MKKFFIKVGLILAFFILSSIIIAIIDPFNVFHYRRIRDNGVEPNKNYIKTRYILDNPGKFDSFLFGSSRVYFINVAAIPDLHCYNMTYSGGIPKEHFDNLETMIQKDIIPKVILMGIDDISCYSKPEINQGSFLCKPHPNFTKNTVIHEDLAYLKFLMKYLDISLFESVPLITSHKGNNKKYREQFYENGGYQMTNEQTSYGYDWENASIYSPPFSYGIDNAIADIQSIIDLCRKYNIKLILFTNPLHKLTYQQAVENGYIDFLMRLSEVTEFYNFSGINDITTNNDNYVETSHYRHNVGDLIIDTIFNNKTDPELLLQGFGYHVTNENRDLLFRNLSF